MLIIIDTTDKALPTALRRCLLKYGCDDVATDIGEKLIETLKRYDVKNC